MVIIQFLLLLIVVGYTNPGHGCPVDNKRIEIVVGGHSLTAEVASDRVSHQCGLAHRSHLPPDHGMLFAYASDRILGFWMRDTLIPLSIAFLDAQREILEIQDMVPEHPYRRHFSKVPARYALEVNRGWFADKAIKPGDRVEFDLGATAKGKSRAYIADD